MTIRLGIGDSLAQDNEKAVKHYSAGKCNTFTKAVLVRAAETILKWAKLDHDNFKKLVRR